MRKIITEMRKDFFENLLNYRLKARATNDIKLPRATVVNVLKANGTKKMKKIGYIFWI